MSDLIPAAAGWAAVYVHATGVDVRPIPFFGGDDGVPWVFHRCSADVAVEVPGFIGIVGPGEDYRVTLREQIAAARKRFPAPKLEREQDVSDYFRDRHP